MTIVYEVYRGISAHRVMIVHALIPECLTERSFTVKRPVSCKMLMKWSCLNLADLIVSCCPSVMKFRIGTEKMWKTFLMAATLTTLSAERECYRMLSSSKRPGNLCNLQLHCGPTAPCCWTRTSSSRVNTVLQSLGACKRCIEIACRKICLLQALWWGRGTFSLSSSTWALNRL